MSRPPPPPPAAGADLCAVLQLELVEEGPGVPQVGVDLHGAVEPLPGLGDLPLTPKQPVGSEGGEPRVSASDGLPPASPCVGAA